MYVLQCFVVDLVLKFLWCFANLLLCVQGTSTDQDTRFMDKEKKLLKQMKFAPSLSKKVRLFSLRTSAT